MGKLISFSESHFPYVLQSVSMWWHFMTSVTLCEWCRQLWSCFYQHSSSRGHTGSIRSLWVMQSLIQRHHMSRTLPLSRTHSLLQRLHQLLPQYSWGSLAPTTVFHTVKTPISYHMVEEQFRAYKLYNVRDRSTRGSHTPVSSFWR